MIKIYQFPFIGCTLAKSRVGRSKGVQKSIHRHRQLAKRLRYLDQTVTLRPDSLLIGVAYIATG